jgi:hypothetical protein
MNQYVRDRAWHYAECFFSAVLQLDNAENASRHQDKEPAQPAKPRGGRTNKKKAADTEP